MEAELLCRVTIPLERDAFIPVDAATTDLSNLNFSFENGNPFGVISPLVTFTIGATTPTVASSLPFLLSSVEGTASGTLTASQGACQLTVLLSTFPGPIGPQAGDLIPIVPCQIDALDGRLITAVDGMATQTTSQPPTALANHPPVLMNPGAQASHESDVIDLVIGASDVNGDPLTFQITGLPPGLQFDTATGQISGQLSPTASAGSPYTVAVSVSDGTIDVNTSFSWTVNRPVWGQMSWGEARWNKP